jgi:hypothetical protein
MLYLKLEYRVYFCIQITENNVKIQRNKKRILTKQAAIN